jgi:glycerophosphoryl diester phosphodiesterase
MSRPTLRLAHRGDWRHAPENTVAAFRAALAMPGCDGVELDVRFAADGTPVVIHDETLERVQGRAGRVNDLSAAALAAAGVPTLAEALRELPQRAFVDVELKADVGPAVIEVLAAARGPDLRRAVVSSFDAATLEGIRRRAPAWPCWLISDNLEPQAIRTAADLGCVAVAADWRTIDRRSVARARAGGVGVAAWTVRRRPTFQRLAGLGVVAVCVEGAALDGDARGPEVLR